MSRKPTRWNNSRKDARKVYPQPKSAGQPLFPRHVFTLTLLALLIFGMVSFTFAYISNNVLDEPAEDSVMMSVRTALAAKDNEDIGPAEAKTDDAAEASEDFITKLSQDLADVGANVDVADTGGVNWPYSSTYYVNNSIQGKWGNDSGCPSASYSGDNGKNKYYDFYLKTTDTAFDMAFYCADWGSDGRVVPSGGTQSKALTTSGQQCGKGSNGTNGSWNIDPSTVCSSDYNYTKIRAIVDLSGYSSDGAMYYSATGLVNLSPTLSVPSTGTARIAIALTGGCTDTGKVGTLTGTYQYSTDNGTTWTDLASASYTATTAGTVKFRYKVTDSGVITDTSSTSVNARTARVEYSSVQSCTFAPANPSIQTFTIDNASSATLAVDGTATLAHTTENAGVGNTVSYSVTSQTPSDGTGNVVTISNSTVTAVQPGTATIQAAMAGTSSTKTVSVTVSAPTISPDTAISLYIDETSGTSGAVTGSPTGSSVSYASANTSVFSVNSLGLVTPVGLGTANLNITFTYANGYSKTFTRSVTVKARDIYLIGLKNDYNWNIENNNKMSYNESTGKYEITRYLFRESTTYGGTTQTNPGDSAFLVNIGTSKNEYGYTSAGYTINGMTYNNITLTNASGYKSVCLKTKDMTSVVASGSKAPYKFVFDYDTKVITVNYPMIVTFNKGTAYTGSTPASQIVNYGGKATDPNLSQTGYNLNGWYTNSDFSGTAFNFASDTVTSDITLYAKWTAKTTTVTLDKNHSDAVAGTASVTAEYGKAMPTAGVTMPTRTGYDFLGYFDTSASTGGTRYYTATGDSATTWDKENASITLYARWAVMKSTLSFNMNSGSGTAPSPALVATYGQAMPAYTGTYPTRTGYTFTGFFDAQTGGTQYYTPANNGTTIQSARTWDKETDDPTTLYAHWTVNSYKVIFSGQYRSGSPSTWNAFDTMPANSLKLTQSGVDTNLPDSGNYYHSYNYGTAVRLTADNNISGYTFEGIYNSSGTKVSTGTNNYYDIASMPAGNVTYYARYTQNLAAVLTWTATNKNASDHPTTMSYFTFTGTGSGGSTGDYSTQTFYYKYNDDANWTVIDTPSSWKPQHFGTYHFKVNINDGATNVDSPVVDVTVDKYSEYFTITTTPGDETANVVYTQIDYTEAIGSEYYETHPTVSALGGSTLKIQISRPTNISGHNASDYYFSSVSVTMAGESDPLYSATNLCADIPLTVLTENVSGIITVSYTMSLKPCVTITANANATHELAYVSEGSDTTASSAGAYYVDYNTNITYTATANYGQYIDSITADWNANAYDVNFVSDHSEGTLTVSGGVTVDGTITTVTQGDKTVTFSLASGSSGGSLTIDGHSGSFDTAAYLNYNTPVNVVITPPEGQYVASVALASGSASPGAVTMPVSYDNGSYTITGLTLTGQNVSYVVTYAANPVVHLEQPQYGSIYITSGSASTNDLKYYFDGDSVEHNTVLTIHVVADSPNDYHSPDKYFPINYIYYQRTGDVAATALSTSPTSPAAPTDIISSDTTYTADIGYALSSIDAPNVSLSYRRIIFTDNQNWSGSAGTDPVYVHFSSSTSSYAIGTSASSLSHNVQMHFMYTDGYGAKILYADIPLTAQYVFFFQGGDDYLDSNVVPVTRTEYASVLSGTGSGVSNAFASDNTGGAASPVAITDRWQCGYADFRSVGSAGPTGDKQQKVTSLNKAAVFGYEYDYGDSSLCYEVVDGCACTVRFSNGTLRITPTEYSENTNFSLVRVYSNSSGNAKYYLIRINNFNLHDMDVVQKLYNAAASVYLKTRAFSSGTLSYSYSYSKNNIDNFTAVSSASDTTSSSVIGDIAYSLRKAQINYIAAFRGITYFKAEVSDNLGNSDERSVRTVFDLDSASGEKVIYLNNLTNFGLDDYCPVAGFVCEENGVLTRHYVTMRKVKASESRYRAVIPADAQTVTFYLMYPDCSPEDYSQIDAVYVSDGNSVFYYSKSLNYEVSDNTKVFNITSISTEELEGEFSNY